MYRFVIRVEVQGGGASAKSVQTKAPRRVIGVLSVRRIFLWESDTIKFRDFCPEIA